VEIFKNVFRIYSYRLHSNAVGEGVQVSRMTHDMVLVFLGKGSGGRERFDRKETNYRGYSVTTNCKHSEVLLKLRIF